MLPSCGSNRSHAASTSRKRKECTRVAHQKKHQKPTQHQSRDESPATRAPHPRRLGNRHEKRRLLAELLPVFRLLLFLSQSPTWPKTALALNLLLLILVCRAASSCLSLLTKFYNKQSLLLLLYAKTSPASLPTAIIAKTTKKAHNQAVRQSETKSEC